MLPSRLDTLICLALPLSYRCVFLPTPVVPGDVVFMSSYALGRSPAIWNDPLTYDPSRFSPEAEASHHRFQYLPFGAGARMCLGASFAQMSVSLMVATLLQRFRFEPVKPNTQQIPVQYDITMNFNGTKGLHMMVTPRHAVSQQQLPVEGAAAETAAAMAAGRS